MITLVEVRSARSVPIGELLNPAGLAANLWRSRGLIRQFIGREAAARHKGTHLGLLWGILQPLATLGVYTFLFGVVFKVRWGEKGGDPHAEYALTAFCGLILFTVFQEGLNRASTLIVDRPNFVRKVVFPLEILPIALIGSSLLYTAAEVAILLAAVGIVYHTFSWTVVFFPLVLLPLVMLTLGLGWFLASLGVFVRDIRQVVTVAVQLMFILTPIFFPLTAVPEAYRPLLLLNPLATIVDNGRRTLMWGEMPDWIGLGIVTAAAAVVMQLGYAWFMKSKKGFADVI